jgi:hypothetical protein
MALMIRANAATMTALPMFRQQCRDTPSFFHEAISYRKPRPTPNRCRCRCVVAAPWPAADAVEHSAGRVAGVQRQRAQDAAGGRVEPAAAWKGNRAAKRRSAGAKAKAKATAGEAADSCKAETGTTDCEKAGAAASNGSATSTCPATPDPSAKCRAGATSVAYARAGRAASGHVGDGGGCTGKTARCRHCVARRHASRG